MCPERVPGHWRNMSRHTAADTFVDTLWYVSNVSGSVQEHVRDTFKRVQSPGHVTRTCPSTCTRFEPESVTDVSGNVSSILASFFWFLRLFSPFGEDTSRKRSSQKWALLKSRFYSQKRFLQHFFPTTNFENGVYEMSLTPQTG